MHEDHLEKMITPGVLAINDNGGMFINFVLYERYNEERSDEETWWILAHSVMPNMTEMYAWPVDDMEIIE